MSYRKKILIIEHDDFLREILGNLLHKRGGYILNAACLNDSTHEAQNHQIDTIIVGSSCSDYKGKQTINYLEKTFQKPEIYFINTSPHAVNYLPKENQFLLRELSVKSMLDAILPEQHS